MNLDWIQEKVLPQVLKVTNSKPLVAVKDGVVSTLPLTVVGSMFLLIACFPIKAVTDFLDAMQWTPILFQGFGATFNLLALVIAFAIAYSYTKNEGLEGMSAGIVSMISFILLINHSVEHEGKTVGGVIPTEWLGAKGIIGAIFIGLFCGYVYSWFVKRRITIKMPASVPEGVANSFISIIPAAFIFSIMTVFYGILKLGMKTTFLEIIYKTIQTPLQHLTSTFAGACIASVLISLLWWFGVHGAVLVSSVLKPILLSNMIANQQIIDSGVKLTAQNGFIYNENFSNAIITVTGSGITLGLVLYMMFLAKSEQLKAVGKMSFVPGIFNINEPVTFGVPIVLNPHMFLPFVLTPLACTSLGYFLSQIGILPLMGSVCPPWTTPPILSGLLIQGWQLALFQVVIVVISFLIYYPFIKKQDEILYKQETEGVSE